MCSIFQSWGYECSVVSCFSSKDDSHPANHILLFTILNPRYQISVVSSFTVVLLVQEGTTVLSPIISSTSGTGQIYLSFKAVLLT